ncbi:MAG: class A beta-lactamase-related serine hydrolase [Bacteroidetes bacterium]|nr:class A beta-lactamase-related serine hydrolase [Bacteroidota bacterium]MBU1116331.1 class A beta-lactamase-related serine hydrolase [Bacteroidota bacterium]MBU1796904.1 class A beta-lactamase-related serine hydrolase [Bacteroidota bacterium]
MKLTFFVMLICYATLFSQNSKIPDYYNIDSNLTLELQNIVNTLELDKNFNVGEDGIEQISLAVIDLNNKTPSIGGVNMDNFIYPASVYKMYVAAEILNQISQGKYSLSQMYVVKSPNDVDKSKEIPNDPRPLLQNGDTVTVNYLLDLMITRSDNSAANCLIDIAKRENINNLINSYNWVGSEVTRKFLSRKYEDSGYEKIRGTETCALHAADFMYLIQSNRLVNPWVSMQMKALLGRQLDNTKLSTGLPKNTMFFHKTGWYSFWTNDVGIVDDGKLKYIVACFLPLEEEIALGKLKLLSEKINTLIRNRNLK